jgi:hypothetical protein
MLNYGSIAAKGCGLLSVKSVHCNKHLHTCLHWRKYKYRLKGQCHENFCLRWLFNPSSSPVPPLVPLEPFRFFLKKFAKIMAKGTASVIDNGGKYTAGIVVTSSRGILYIFFGGLECVGYSFAYVAHLWFLRDVLIRTQSIYCRSKLARYRLSHPSLYVKSCPFMVLNIK